MAALRMWIAAAVVVGAFVSETARSAEVPFPSHDAEADCTAMARGMPMPDNSTAMPTPHNQCIDDEQVGYDYLKSVWADLPDEIRAQCQSMNNVPSWSRYQSWAGCIHPLFEAWQQTHEFQK